MTKNEKINLIYKHTAIDYRLIINGEKYVMVFPGKLSSLSAMNEGEFNNRFQLAKRLEKKHIRDKKIFNIVNKFGLIQYYDQSKQWRNSKRDLIEYFSFVLNESNIKKFEEALIDIEFGV